MKMILRTQGAFNLADVEYAILEANGRISTLLKSQVRPATPKDFGIDTEYQGIPIDLISDGKIIADNLNLVGLTEDWLRGKLSELRLKPEDVFYAELDTSGKSLR